MADHRDALEDLRRLLASDERLRRRTLAAAASGELERLTRPEDSRAQISVRVPTVPLERCDALAAALQGIPDVFVAPDRATRALELRLALKCGLEQLEGQHGAGMKRRR
jgi:hypothetical protein